MVHSVKGKPKTHKVILVSAKTNAKQSARNEGETFTPEEIAAMRTRAQELKAGGRANKNREQGETSLLGAISAMKEPDRSMGKRLHQIITAAAPELMPKTWYGMPAYTNKEGKVICFFQAASKFNTRYAAFGFQPDAHLDEGNMWATAFALIELNSTEEEKIKALVIKAVR